MATRSSRGQALAEFALVLPFLLFVILGGLALGLMMLDRMELTHAAQEGAVAGAAIPGDSCGVAIETARKVYGKAFTSEECAVKGQLIEISVVHRLPLVVPLWSDHVDISVTERAALR